MRNQGNRSPSWIQAGQRTVSQSQKPNQSSCPLTTAEELMRPCITFVSQLAALFSGARKTQREVDKYHGKWKCLSKSFLATERQKLIFLNISLRRKSKLLRDMREEGQQFPASRNKGQSYDMTSLTSMNQLRFSRETEPIGYVQTYKRRFIIGIGSHNYGGESHDLPSASWRTRKTGSVSQSESKENQGSR